MSKIGLFDKFTGGKSSKFQSPSDVVPLLTDQIIVITGANSGLGKVSTIEFAKKGAHVVLLCRSESKAKAVMEDLLALHLKASFIPCDLSDWKSVVEAAHRVKALVPKIDVLMNNAGIMAPKEYGECAQGIEMQLSSNHFGHFILTRELFGHVVDGGRIVNLSSLAHTWSKCKGKPGFDFERMRKGSSVYSPYDFYGHSKLANILFTRELTKLTKDCVKKVYINAVHPGIVKTNLINGSSFHWFTKLIQWGYSEEDVGAMTQMYVATHPDIVKNEWKGEYFIPCCQLGKTTAAGEDSELQSEFWKWSMDVLKEKGFDGEWIL